MSNATLVITATVTNGGGSKDVELQQCKRACELALMDSRGNGTGRTSGTVGDNSSGASATWTYTPVASK
jgi:hypothetical protein